MQLGLASMDLNDESDCWNGRLLENDRCVMRCTRVGTDQRGRSNVRAPETQANSQAQSTGGESL